MLVNSATDPGRVPTRSRSIEASAEPASAPADRVTLQPTGTGETAPSQPGPSLQASPSRVLPEGATLQKLSGDFSFAEGLTCDRDGSVFFTDQPNNKIYKYSVDGQLSLWKEPSGRANGMTFDPKGNLIACSDEHDELWSIAPDGKSQVLASGYQGHLFNGPNDVWCMPDQKLYLTDPFYDRPYWDHHQQPQDSEQVYLLSPENRTIQRVTDDLVKPNGIVGSPDGKKLFVSDIGADKTYAYDVDAQGGLTHKRLACAKGSDGMTIDDQGNLYLTGNGVTVFDPEGKQIEHIDVPEDWVGNICFGGKDKKTLFIAASKGLYSIRTNFAGANPAK